MHSEGKNGAAQNSCLMMSRYSEVVQNFGHQIGVKTFLDGGELSMIF